MTADEIIYRALTSNRKYAKRYRFTPMQPSRENSEVDGDKVILRTSDGVVVAIYRITLARIQNGKTRWSSSWLKDKK